MSDIMRELCEPIQPLLEEKGVETDELSKLAYCFALGIANPSTRRNTESKLHSEWKNRFEEERGVLLLKLLLSEASIMAVIIAFGDKVGHESIDKKRPAVRFSNSDHEAKMRLANSSIKDFASLVYPTRDWNTVLTE